MTCVVATVLVHDNPTGLREVVRHLAAQERRPDAVVIVDNASAAAVSLSDMDLRGMPAQLARSERNLGVGAGHNLGVRVARDVYEADVVWVLEHDTLPDAGCLAALLSERSHHQDLVVVVAELVRNNYERGWLDLAADGELLDRCTFNGPLIDVGVIDAVGVFNESYFVGQEDWEFSQRVVAASFPILRCSSAVAVHAHKGDQRFGGYVSPTRLYYSSRNLLAAQLPLGVATQLLELLLVSGKSVRELSRKNRGGRYAAARWWAYWDGRSGRLGERHHRSVSGPSALG